MIASRFGVTVIGGGPAGIAAAIAASVDGASVLLIERAVRLGGLLRQCIHDGFGNERYGERLTGPEYAFKDISVLEQTNVVVLLQTSVVDISRSENVIQLNLSNRHGTVLVESKSVVIATGAGEKNAFQMGIHGTRPAGVMTALSAQYYINIMGQLPFQRCMVLGSDDVALIVARRLTIEGCKVFGIYEPSDKPLGKLSNVSQCLFDYDIPLNLNHTVTRLFGTQRLRAVELYRVDKALNLIKGSMNVVKTDGLVLSAGLIPDTDIAQRLGVPISTLSDGPICDQNYMTLVDGVFACGNALQVSDVVEYVSESAEIAGRSASRYMARERSLIEIELSKEYLTATPLCIDPEFLFGQTVMFFKVAAEKRDATVKILADNREIFTQKYEILRPSLTERIVVDFSGGLTAESKIIMRME